MFVDTCDWVFTDKLKQEGGGGADESGLYEMLQEYMVENEALRYACCVYTNMKLGYGEGEFKRVLSASLYNSTYNHEYMCLT